MSTVIAWTTAVLFAFITNKIWVFESKTYYANNLIREIAFFFVARIITGFIDVVIMYVAVDLLLFNPSLWKFISNITIIGLNYIASKLVVFRK